MVIKAFVVNPLALRTAKRPLSFALQTLCVCPPGLLTSGNLRTVEVGIEDLSNIDRCVCSVLGAVGVTYRTRLCVCEPAFLTDTVQHTQ